MMDANYTPYSIWNAGDAVTGCLQPLQLPRPEGIYRLFRWHASQQRKRNHRHRRSPVLLLSNGFVLTGLATQNQILVRSGSNYHVSNFTADSMLIGADSPVTARLL